MSENRTEPTGDLHDEFINLGRNLKEMFASAWESEERKKLQSELEEGMRELGAALNTMAEDLRASQTGQKLRQEVDEFSERVRSGEVELKAREEIIKVLKALNGELEKAAEKFNQPPTD
jgi:hypothetical protein